MTYVVQSSKGSELRFGDGWGKLCSDQRIGIGGIANNKDLLKGA